jgi:hypothetical protein
MIVISLVMNVGLPGAMWPQSRFGIKARSGSGLPRMVNIALPQHGRG